MSLSPKKLGAIDALLTEPSIAKAANRSGVDERSLYRWLRDDDFQKALAERRRDLVGHASRRLQSVASDAVDVLRKVMVDKKIHASVRLGAARAVLDFAFRSSELEDCVLAIREHGKRINELIASRTGKRPAVTAPPATGPHAGVAADPRADQETTH